MSDESHALDGILDQIVAAADGEEHVRMGTLVESFGQRGYGALLAAPALLEISPIGGIPGVPSVLALVVVLFAVQMLGGREHMWLPGFLNERTLSAERLGKAVEKARPFATRLDRWFHGRLDALTGPLAARLVAAICVLLACTVPPLEVVPFASTAPMAAILLFGIALLVHDGVVMLVAFALATTALGTLGTTLL